MGLPAAIAAKNELIKISLELITGRAVIGSDQPLLEIANCAVLPEAAGTSHLCEGRCTEVECEPHAEILPPARQSFEAIGVYSRARYHNLLRETEERCALEIWDHSHASAPG